jgi:hypothetical protein
LQDSIRTPEVKKQKALYMRKWLAKRSPEAKALESTRRREKFYALRAKVLDALGGKCKSCGFADERALQIDHINGGGQRERKAMGYRAGYPHTYFTRILADPDFLSKYQCLCANCNWIKRRELKEYNQGVGSQPRKYLQ